MFKGFDVKLPEYEVITPQTHLSFTVRSLNVKEEERLKGSLMTPNKIHEHLNKCIFDSIVQKPEQVTEYDSFLKAVTLKDRDALLYGLYHISYEEIRNYDVTCGSCSKEYPVTVQASSTFNYLPYPGKNILGSKVPIELETTTGVICTIKQPTLFEELTAIKSMAGSVKVNMDLITETLIIDKFEQKPDEGDLITYSDRNDIIDAYLSLPSKDKRQIHKEYRDKFGQYGIQLKMKSNCIHCGEEEEIDLDLVANFFRMVYTF
jgi:hypothetical protein